MSNTGISQAQQFEAISKQIISGDFWSAGAAAKRAWLADSSSIWGWKFKLQYAETLLLTEDRDGAKALLEQVAPAQFATLQPRYEYLRAYAGLYFSEKAAPDRLRAAIAKARALPDPQTEADGLLLLARVEGDKPDAKLLLAQALALAHSRGLEYQEANVLNELGMSALEKENFADAIRPFSDAAALSLRIGARYVGAAAKANLGECYFSMGDLDQALHSFAEARKLVWEADHTELPVNINNQLGTLYSLRQENREALVYYRSAFALSQITGGSNRYINSALRLAEGLIQTHSVDEAEKYNETAARALKKALEGTFPPKKELIADNELNRADIAAARGKLVEAETSYRKVLQILAKEPSSTQWSAYARLAEVEEKLGRIHEARTNFEKALAAIESNRSQQRVADYQITFLSALIRFYQQYVDFLMRQKDETTALAVADSSRGSVLTQGLISSRQKPDFIAEIRHQANTTQSTLLFYWLSPSASYVWAITPSGEFCRRLPRSQEEIEQDVKSYKRFIQNDRMDLLQPANAVGQRLFDTLITPVAEQLRPGMRVVVVPDGALHGLNFETLVVKGNQPHYWLEDAMVTVAPSLGILLTKSKSTFKPGGVLIMGDPIYKNTGFPELPESGPEVKSVSELFPKTSTVLTQGQALADAYGKAQPGNFSLIHFSAHVDANAESPLDSAIIFSPAEGESSRLYARDVMNTPLNADLVTVSGCRSSGSEALSGEGMVGFAWAAFEAGARNAITSLWAVDDRSTADLMNRFYSGVIAGKPYSASLRDAKLQMLQHSSFSKPYYWAPFQLYSRNIGSR